MKASGKISEEANREIDLAGGERRSRLLEGIGQARKLACGASAVRKASILGRNTICPTSLI